MTYVISKLLPRFPNSQEKVCCIKNLFASNLFLIDIYGLNPDDKIIVKHTRRTNTKYKWKNWRTPYKIIFIGTVEQFNQFSYDYYEKNIWKKKQSKTDLSKTQ